MEKAQQAPLGAEVGGGQAAPVSLSPSPLRAWCYLVWLSGVRQARMRQMVWIALALLALATALVAINTVAGGWEVGNWRYPRGSGLTFTSYGDQVQVVSAALPRGGAAQAVQVGVLGSFRAALRDPEFKRLSALLVFAHSVVFSAFLTFLLPMWSLSFATESFGGEREANSLIWLLTRPLPRPAVYLAKFVALLPWSVGLNVGGFALICLVGGEPGWQAFRLFWPAVLAATLAFAALFFLLGASFRRPAVVGLVYSFCLEVVLGSMPGYLKRVSVGFYARCMMFEAAADYGVQPDNPTVFLPVDGTTALVVLLGATAVLLAVGMTLFARSQYHEAV